MTKLIYSNFVKRDLKEIKDWYRKIDVKLWNDFVREFKSKVILIKENPLSFEIKYDEIRIVFLKRFPFGIHYFYDKEKNAIEIYSIFHTSRNPEQWKDRK
ncbi:type II toxin-antitoxin system RelE/ParE family toxin [Chryseobacterium zhengzhouense]|uniref:Type II toxin-antitoxin system RelE/ParE family toxin n=1 Tax=Chryseobacterium zhengzhouense TaxID=1636086 RepID=A0ABW2LUT0_9FLAO